MEQPRYTEQDSHFRKLRKPHGFVITVFATAMLQGNDDRSFQLPIWNMLLLISTICWQQPPMWSSKCTHWCISFFFLNHHFMAKPRDWQAVKNQRKHISSDAVLRHSKARRICHEIRDHKCKSFLHVCTCTDIFDSDHDVSVVPRLSGSPEKNWQLFLWSKPPLSWAQLTLEPLLGEFLRFVIVTQRDESRFLSSQLIKFLLLQIIYHTPTAPRLVYYPQSPEASKPILIKSV